MKRSLILMLLAFFILGGLSGCILSTNPNPAIPITLKVGNSQAFTVSGFLNGPYAWYKNDTLIGGAAGATYTFYAEALDKGTNKIRVETRDLLSNQTLTKEWTVEVYYNMPPIANAGLNQNVYFGNDVYLDGSHSSDFENQPLIYLWTILQRPQGSSATLSSTAIVNPSFTPDKEGAYTIQLIVNDGESNSASDAVVINVSSNFEIPVADAGPDQTIGFPGIMAHLDGSDSDDPEGHTLTYLWAIDSGPAGTGATLDDPTSMTPSFLPDKKGVYVIRLQVWDGTFWSGIAWVNITVSNKAPVANAGDDITIPDSGGTANLDGSASSDPDDGTTLTYAWTVTSRPGGSTAQIVNPSSETPTFTPDRKGGYIITLVVSDGDLTAEDTVGVNYSNHVPVAEAGDAIVIEFTQTAQLNGGASHDPDGDPLTYAWTITGRPAESTANLSNANIYNPTFTPDKKGVYTMSLIVTDNDTPPLSSAPDTVTVTTLNNAPVANAGMDFNILNKHLVQLNGSGTDIDGDTITGYEWTVTQAPSGSSAALSNRNIANPTFMPDRKGFYTLSLVVYDGEAWSLADTMQINATNNTPVAEAGAASQVVHFANRVVLLNGFGSSDLDPEDTLYYTWTLHTKPSDSSATIVNPLTVNPVITLDVPGTYVINLVVNDGTLNSNIDSITFTTPQATYTTGWENGLNDSNGVAWVASSSGSINANGTDSGQSHSGSYALYQQTCSGDSCGAGYAKMTNYSGKFVISVSYWAFTLWTEHYPPSGAGLYEGDIKRVDYPGNNSWTQYTWSPYRIVTDLNFKTNNPGGTTLGIDWRGNMHIDDVSVTVWE